MDIKSKFIECMHNCSIEGLDYTLNNTLRKNAENLLHSAYTQYTEERLQNLAVFQENIPLPPEVKMWDWNTLVIKIENQMYNYFIYYDGHNYTVSCHYPGGLIKYNMLKFYSELEIKQFVIMLLNDNDRFRNYIYAIHRITYGYDLVHKIWRFPIVLVGSYGENQKLIMDSDLSNDAKIKLSQNMSLHFNYVNANSVDEIIAMYNKEHYDKM